MKQENTQGSFKRQAENVGPSRIPRKNVQRGVK